MQRELRGVRSASLFCELSRLPMEQELPVRFWECEEANDDEQPIEYGQNEEDPAPSYGVGY
jgi:hypothetical protein